MKLSVSSHCLHKNTAQSKESVIGRPGLTSYQSRSHKDLGQTWVCITYGELGGNQKRKHESQRAVKRETEW